MQQDYEIQDQDKRFVREIGRPYFLPFFIMFIVAIFGEIQVAMATFELPAIWNGSFLFSHFGLFLSLSILTMAGVAWAVRNGINENQRRVALAALTTGVVMVVFFWPLSSEPLAPVFRLSVEAAQNAGDDLVSVLREGANYLQ